MKRYNLRFRSADRNIFEAIRNGTKTVETRAATKRYRNVKAGDRIILVCGNEELEKIVAQATIFNAIEALLKTYSIKEINPNIGSKEELMRMYDGFPGYVQKIKECGILAMKFE